MPTPTEKKIVYESRAKQIALLTISWLFTIAGVLTGQIWGAVFFGFCATIATYKLFNPKIKILYFGTPEYERHIRMEFENHYNDNGVFTFNEIGFAIRTKEGEQPVLWAEVKSMIGYKEDRYTIDSICLDVFCDNDKSFKITEETPGWFQFLDHSKKALPIVDKSWEIEISTPAFVPNLTIIFDRENRQIKEVTDEYYGAK